MKNNENNEKGNSIYPLAQAEERKICMNECLGNNLDFYYLSFFPDFSLNTINNNIFAGKIKPRESLLYSFGFRISN